MIESGFFNKYPRFFKTARASKIPDRINIRYQGLIERNKALLVNKKILDLASHDGRWSFAALKAGAHYVIGIEGREELIKDSYENFRAYDINPSKYKFFLGDILTVLSQCH
jgi:23S rRNA G2069 N7-methylase RlmK/C1962 C5-methylase RlmI